MMTMILLSKLLRLYIEIRNETTKQIVSDLSGTMTSTIYKVAAATHNF